MMPSGNSSSGGIHEQVGKDHRAGAVGTGDGDGRAEPHGKRKPRSSPHGRSGTSVALADREYRRSCTAVTVGSYGWPGATFTLGSVADGQKAIVSRPVRLYNRLNAGTGRLRHLAS